MDDNMSIILFVGDFIVIMRKQQQQKPACTYIGSLPPPMTMIMMTHTRT